MSRFHDILSRLAYGETLDRSDASFAFGEIMSGRADLAQVSAFAMALRVRGETVDEIVGGAQILREKAALINVPEQSVDTCGTGGDGLGTYNISTASALLAASMGVPVAKHGNRSVSSKSGSADVLMALGANLELPLDAHTRSIAAHNFTFLFAPQHHKAMRHAAPVRGSLKLRTVFNLLGPLANPGRCKRQVLGVFDKKWVPIMAEVLKALGSEKVWVVHGADGLDELSVSAETYVAELEEGTIREFTITPEEAGLGRHPVEALRGGDAEENAQALYDLFDGAASAYRDIVLLNTAAALVVADKTADLKTGAAMAAEAIDTGRARDHLNGWIAFTHGAGA